MSELGYEAHLLLDFVPVGVVGPEEDVQSHGKRLPNQLKGAVLVVSPIPNRSQPDVQEADGGGQADHRNEEDGVESDEVREGDCVEELDLYQRVVRVEVEVDVHHDVEDDDEAEDDEV